MRKLVLVGIMLLATAGYVLAASPTVTINGWVGDSHCGAAGKGPGHAACARSCVRNGNAAILINDKDGKVISISNQDAVKSFVGDHVAVRGEMASNGSIHVNSVKTLGAK